MKILLDCDTGIDDAVAIGYALASPEAEIVAIGSVHGNIESDVAADNTLKLLKAAGRTDIPVAVGAPKPLLRPLQMAKFVHGEDGLGNTQLASSGLAVSGEHAADQIIRLTKEQPGEITLVATGPLTNLGLALIKEPGLAELIPHVVLMGGTAAEPGNVTPVAEANIWHDPEAASLVFSAPWHITMAGLDVTSNTLLLERHLDRWKESGNPLALWLRNVVPFYFDFYSASLGRRACVMHDSVAVGLALGLAANVKAHNLPVSVSTEDGPALGQTVVDRRSLVSRAFTPEGAHTDVVVSMDADAFMEDLVERIARYGAAG